jgi:hypothetical protein
VHQRTYTYDLQPSSLAESGLTERVSKPLNNPMIPTHTCDIVRSPPSHLGLFVEMGSFRDKGHLFVDPYQVDTGAQLVSGVHPPLDMAESLRIRYLRICGVLLGLMISSKGGK